jgi:hypothetical protein
MSSDCSTLPPSVIADSVNSAITIRKSKQSSTPTFTFYSWGGPTCGQTASTVDGLDISAPNEPEISHPGGSADNVTTMSDKPRPCPDPVIPPVVV